MDDELELDLGKAKDDTSDVEASDEEPPPAKRKKRSVQKKGGDKSVAADPKNVRQFVHFKLINLAFIKFIDREFFYALHFASVNLALN